MITITINSYTGQLIIINIIEILNIEKLKILILENLDRFKELHFKIIFKGEIILDNIFNLILYEINFEEFHYYIKDLKNLIIELDIVFINDLHILKKYVRIKNLQTYRISEIEYKNIKNIIIGKLKNVMHSDIDIEFKKEIIRIAIEKKNNIFEYVPSDILNDKKFILSIINMKYWYIIKHLPENMRDDIDIILAAIKQDWRAFKYISYDIKDDNSIVLAIKQNCYYNMNDNSSVLSVKQNSCYDIDLALNKYDFQNLKSDLKNNYKIVFIAVQKNGLNLQFASIEFRNNRTIVLEAVRQCGYALEYASFDLRNDPEIVLEAVQKTGDALRYASEDLRDNYPIVLAACKQNEYALIHTSINFITSYECLFNSLK